MNRSEDTIFWFDSKVNVGTQNAKKIATLNLSVGSKEKDEGIIKMDSSEYRIWKPHRSKLAAAIINGMEIFPILKKSKILYFDATMENTASYISDIVGNDGKIFVVVNSNKPSDFMQKMIDRRSNITMVHHTENLVQHKSINDKVDVIYMNVSDKNNLDIAILNSKAYLKDGGYLLLVVKTADILVNKYGVEPENNQRKKIRMLFEMIQEINLADFFKDNTMIVAKFLSS